MPIEAKTDGVGSEKHEKKWGPGNKDTVQKTTLAPYEATKAMDRPEEGGGAEEEENEKNSLLWCRKRRKLNTAMNVKV